MYMLRVEEEQYFFHSQVGKLNLLWITHIRRSLSDGVGTRKTQITHCAKMECFVVINGVVSEKKKKDTVQHAVPKRNKAKQELNRAERSQAKRTKKKQRASCCYSRNSTFVPKFTHTHTRAHIIQKHQLFEIPACFFLITSSHFDVTHQNGNNHCVNFEIVRV